jgi:hypothetical protein
MTTRPDPDPVPVAPVSDAFKGATLAEANSEFLRKQLAADTDPVPAALFEAAVRYLRDQESMADCDLLSREAARYDESWGDTAERLIRQAVAGGVREEGAG